MCDFCQCSINEVKNKKIKNKRHGPSNIFPYFHEGLQHKNDNVMIEIFGSAMTLKSSSQGSFFGAVRKTKK